MLVHQQLFGNIEERLVIIVTCFYFGRIRLYIFFNEKYINKEYAHTISPILLLCMSVLIFIHKNNSDS